LEISHSPAPVDSYTGCSLFIFSLSSYIYSLPCCWTVFTITPFKMHFSTLTQIFTLGILATAPLVAGHDVASAEVARRFVVRLPISTHPPYI
jgi:hypothetical protein